MTLSDQTDRQEKDTARATLSGLLAEAISAKRKKPTGDLINHPIEATDEGDRLSEQELMAMCFVIIAAGFEATVNLIGNCVLALLHIRPTRATTCRLITPPSSGRRVPDVSAAPSVLRLQVHDRSDHRRRYRDPANEFIMISTAVGEPRLTIFDLPPMLDIVRKPNSHLALDTAYP